MGAVSILACEECAEGWVTRSQPARVFFFFFFKVEINSQAPISPFEAKDQSTVGQRAETTVNELSMTSCVGACLLDGFPRCARTAQSAQSDSVGSRV